MENQSNTKFILGITLKLLVISLVTALLLSCVNALTKDQIAENVAREKEAAISAIFPNATENTAIELDKDGMNALYIVYSNGKAIGYTAEVAPLGFGGELTLMVGVDVNGNIAGVKLISHSETPGLGSRVGDAGYLAQYIGRNSAAIDAGVDLITGSTVSSKAVLEGVKTAVSVFDTVYPMFVGGGAQ